MKRAYADRSGNLTKKDQVVLVWNWIERVYVSPYTPPHFEVILKKAVDLALIYHRHVNAEGVNSLRRRLTRDMITRGVWGLAQTAVLYFAIIAFHTKGRPWLDGSLFVFGALFLALNAIVAAPFIYGIDRTIRASLSSVATPFSDPRLVHRLRNTYEGLAENSKQVIVDKDSKDTLWQSVKTRYKISDRWVIFAKWSLGIVMAVLLSINVWAGVAGNLNFIFLILKLITDLWIVAVVLRSALIVQRISGAVLSASTRRFFKERLFKVAVALYRVVISLVAILILCQLTTDHFAEALFVSMSCLAVASICLEVSYYTLRFMNDYKVQVDETTELLYGLMTDRKISVAKAIIKQIVNDSGNLTTLDPDQLKEEILTLETALSRILLNRAVYRYARSAQKGHDYKRFEMLGRRQH